jgi:feruloyl esterase
VWRNGAGDAVIESYTIANMAHGTPLATGDADSECGNAGPFLLEAGISSSFHIAGFFGLAAEAARTTSKPERASAFSQIREAILPQRTARPIMAPSLPDISGSQHRISPPRAYPVDIGAVITGALQAAGLMKK